MFYLKNMSSAYLQKRPIGDNTYTAQGGKHIPHLYRLMCKLHQHCEVCDVEIESETKCLANESKRSSIVILFNSIQLISFRNLRFFPTSC